MRSDSSMSNSSLIVAIATIAGLFLALFIGKEVGNQSYLMVFIILGAMFGLLIFFALGDKYWYLIPFSLISGLPAIPIGGKSVELAELAIAACTIVFVARISLKKSHLILLRTTHTPILLYVLWVAIIFYLNPIGLQMLGAGFGGARFYVKIALAFSAFLICASTPISEADAKWIIRLIIIGTLLRLLYSLADWFVLGGGATSADSVSTSGESDDYYTWHQILSFPAFTAAFLIFSRYKPSEVFGFKRPFITIVYALAVALSLFSGKRMGVVAVVLAPFVGSLIFRQYRYFIIALIFFVVTATVVIIGHGQVFSFPMTVQRALSWLPAQWDPDLHAAGTTDEFRAELRRLAIEEIQRNPVMGKGFSIDIAQTGSAINAAMYLGGITTMVLPYALGKSWHNTWLGYAADFGIPLSFIQASVFLTVIIVSVRTFRKTQYSSLLQTLVIYILIYAARDVLASQTSGHSALDAFDRWWMYGILFSIAGTVGQKALNSDVIISDPKPVIRETQPISARATKPST